jgi:RNA polymerase sigma factor (sigma-70 family)
MVYPSLPVACSGESLFVSQLPTIERVIEFVCRRHHLSATDAEDFCSSVKLKFIENNYAILSKFEGRSALSTFLAVTIEHLYLDHQNKHWGKWRPSAAAKRYGPIGILLEQLTVRDGFSFDEACQALRTNHGVEASDADLNRIIAALPARTPRRFTSDSSLERVVTLEVGDAAAALEHSATADRISAILRTVLDRLEPQDRVILTMRFEDGLTVAHIATAIRHDQRLLYRRVDKLLRMLRTELESAGVDAHAVAVMLEDRNVDLTWFRSAKFGGARPSTTHGVQRWR